MPLTNGDDFQTFAENTETAMPELEVGPRAERPNFLTATRFVDFDLPQEIMEGLDSAGFEYCTPIQAQAIPVAMKGDDIAGQAQTGTGKTTAFLVPMLNRLLKNKALEPGVPRALIVTPTRELALQIYEDARVLAKNTRLESLLVIGGMEYKEQADALQAAPEIVICTPGRVIDYIKQGVFKTRGVEVAVVDEADRLLDMGFIHDLKYILSTLPPFTSRQTMLFSATLDDRVLELTYQYMNPPQYITAEPDKSTKVNIKQELYHVGRDEKLSLLLGLLRREEHRRVIIFSNTKSGVEWISKKLTMNGFQAEGITGDLPQPKRLKLMEAFKENRLQILVATDVASRGIHVDDVSHVYNYDLPQDAENYIHRIGRTARAGRSGKAISFGCEDYVFHLEAIENLLGEKIPVMWPEAEWFQEDVGGEVRLKGRHSDRDKRHGERGDKRGERGEGRREGGAGRVSRGPAKSQRPGGIFGLAPRLSSGNGEDSARQTLDWTLEEAPIIDAEILEMSVTAETAQEPQEKEGGGRKRKRRRNKRGRGGEAATEARAVGEELAAQQPEALPQTPEPKAAEPIETAAPEAEEKPAKKPRRAPSKKAAPTEAQAGEKPVQEKDRYPKKRVSGAEKPKYPTRRVKTEEKPEEPAIAAATTAPQVEKPKRGRPKKAESVAETVVAPEAPEKPKRAAAKKTTAPPAAKKEKAEKPAKAEKAEPKPAKKAAPAKKTAAPASKAKPTAEKKTAPAKPGRKKAAKEVE